MKELIANPGELLDCLEGIPQTWGSSSSGPRSCQGACEYPIAHKLVLEIKKVAEVQSGGRYSMHVRTELSKKIGRY